MPHDLFGDAVIRPARRSARYRALAICSIALHIVVISAVVVAQVLAVGPLPTPRTPLSFQAPPLARMMDIPLPRPSRAVSRDPAPTVSPDAAPVVAPTGVAQETGLENAHVTSEASNVVAGVERGASDWMTNVAPGDRVAPPPPPPQQPIHLHSGMDAPRKIVDIAPAYPAVAQSARVEGIVILEAIIDVTGAVTSVRVLRSLPLLDQAALDAVRQWRYTPARLNGNAVPVVMTVTVKFSLTR